MFYVAACLWGIAGVAAIVVDGVTETGLLMMLLGNVSLLMGDRAEPS